MKKLKLIVLVPAILAVFSLQASTAEAGLLDGVWRGNPGGATYWVRETHIGVPIPGVEVYEFNYRGIVFQGRGTLTLNVTTGVVTARVDSGPTRGTFDGRMVNWSHFVFFNVPIPFPTSPPTTLHLTR